ncbi:hypothetical protein T06_6708 [Trichinella sp. T6]|nr:hypothetical protein T06_6708 [Trichinella sp. T6]
MSFDRKRLIQFWLSAASYQLIFFHRSIKSAAFFTTSYIPKWVASQKSLRTTGLNDGGNGSYVVCLKEYTLTVKNFFLPQLRSLVHI